jgi:hypothetical protein
VSGDPPADRLEPSRGVAAGRQASEHLLHRQPTQQLGAREQLIGRRRQLTRAVRRPHPRPLDRHRTAPEGDRSRPCRTATRSLLCLPLGPASATTSASINAVITRSPAPTASASRPSRIPAATAAIATVTCSAQTAPARPVCRPRSSGREGSRSSPSRQCGVLADAQPRLHGRRRADRQLNFYETRDNLYRPAHATAAAWPCTRAPVRCSLSSALRVVRI